MLNIKHLAMGFIALVFFTGCANQNMKMNREAISDQNKAYPIEKVSFVDDMDVLVSDIKSFKENNFLKVMIEFMNAHSGADRNFVYKIEWYDQYGIMKDSTSWKPQQVIGNQKIKVLEMATLPTMVDYKIIISTKK